ncbi:MAG TPA: ATP-binding protein, partial [Solirubrobacteraceae bacterium]|nr:ATP-binding protein [Solirubrobacteraceae bacterium]
MADLAGSGRRARYIRTLLVVTALVVAVDLAAAVLQIRSNSRSDSARAEVTAGLKYQDDMGTILQDTLAAETGARGYLLTGESSYLGPAKAAVDAAPAALRQIKAGSRGDRVLQRDYTKLVALLEARLKDLVTSVDLFKRGDQAAAIKLVKTNQGNTLTRRVQSLARQMSARSAQRVTSARNSASGAQLWAERAAIAAYLSSALLLAAMVLLFRTYRLAEAARRESRMAQLEAERLNLAKSGFLSRVSHELRTPLNAILGFGQLLERDLVEQGERETLGQMLGAGRHLLAIVDDLLDLSRIEGGELRLSVEPVQIADALAEAKSLISPAATTAAVGVRQRPVNVDLYVRADRQRLIQVLLNLVSNAVKYNRRGGNVVISAGRTDGEMVRVEVSDTGTGISEEAIARLFTPFERLDAASRGIEGTGLGLALARGLVESMGGSLTLASEEGVGTTVSVELPLASADELAAPRPRRADLAALA